MNNGEPDPGSPEHHATETAKMFPCESCGADLEFHIGSQALQCGFCGFEKVIDLSDEAPVDEHELTAALAKEAERRRERRGTAESSAREVHCDTCGGTVLFEGTVISSECPYCGSPVQEESFKQAQSRIPVDGLLPFAVPRVTARENLRAWVQSRWFAPSDFKARGVQGKFNGIYMPFWTYDSMTYTRYRGERGEHYYVKNHKGEREQRTRWYPAFGAFQRFFDDVLICALRDAKEKLVRKLEPWPLDAVIPFNAESLAGYLAMTYEVDLGEGFGQAKARMDDAIESETRRRIGGDEQRIHSIRTRHDALTYKSVSLPVWMLAYQYGKKSYQVMVNARSGEVQGERPWSWVKITLAVLAALVIGGVVYLSQQ